MQLGRQWLLAGDTAPCSGRPDHSSFDNVAS